MLVKHDKNNRYFSILLYRKSVLDLPDGSGSPEILAASIEEEIYKEFKNTDNKYKNKVRSRVANLRDKKNPALRENVLLCSISPERLVKMTPEVGVLMMLDMQNIVLLRLRIGNDSVGATTNTKSGISV